MPELKPVGTLHKVRPRKSHWDMYFPDHADAVAAATLKGSVSVDTVYAGGKGYMCRKDDEYLRDAEIGMIEIYDEAQVRAAKTALDENESRTKEHRKAMKDWQDSTHGAQEVRGTIVDKFYSCREKVRNLEDVLATRAKYIRLANGDEQVADSFLRNAFCDATLNEAKEYEAWKQAQQSSDNSEQHVSDVEEAVQAVS